MNYDKGYYDSQEFREILAKYEQAVKQNAMTYFGINELADLLAYGMSTDKIDIAKNALSIAKSQHPNTVDCKKMEIKFMYLNFHKLMANLFIYGNIIIK